jgi:hypothetical protein
MSPRDKEAGWAPKPVWKLGDVNICLLSRLETPNRPVRSLVTARVHVIRRFMKWSQLFSLLNLGPKLGCNARNAVSCVSPCQQTLAQYIAAFV